MNLTRKFTAAITLAVVLVLGANTAIRIRREHELFVQTIRNDAGLLARAVAGAAERTWQMAGEAEAIDLVEDANQREATAHIRWVWLDAGPDHALAPHLDAAVPERLAGPLVLEGYDPDIRDDAILTYYPVQGPRPAAIEVSQSLAVARGYLRATIVQILISKVVLVIACAFAAWLIILRFIGRPVRALVAHARAIGEGQLGTRLDLEHADEMGVLAREMNAMSERLARARASLERETEAKLAAVQQLRHADRLASVGKLAAGIAHEVGTPLNVITGTAQLVTQDPAATPELREHAEVIGDQARRVAGIVRQLLDFARRRPAARSSQDLAALAGEGRRLLETLARKRGVTLEVDAAAPVRLHVDPTQLHQVITNLVTNAIHASPPGSRVQIRCDQVDAAPPGATAAPRPHARLAVSDAGSGIAPEHRDRIFEPFFTTKDVGEGTGLGLAVVYGIVTEHGGWIDVTSTEGRGSTFSVFLPLALPLEARDGADPDRR